MSIKLGAFIPSLHILGFTKCWIHTQEPHTLVGVYIDSICDMYRALMIFIVSKVTTR